MEEIKSTLSYSIMILYKDFFDYCKEELREMDLGKGTIPFLIAIGREEGCSPSQVKERLNMDFGHVQRTLNKLIEANLVVSKRNGRSHQLSLTDKGIEAYKRCQSLFLKWDEERLKVLNNQEKQTLQEIFMKLEDKI